MTFTFAPAGRKQGRVRMAISGSSGSGKTLTALTLMTELTGSKTVGDGRARIAFVDTERESSSKYAANPSVKGVDKLVTGSAEAGGYGFSEISPVRYDPRELVAMIDAAASSKFAGLVVDSLSHYWTGPGGMLDIVEGFTRNSRGNSMQGWREAGPIERAYIEALLGYPGHVIVTMRAKQSYVIDDSEGGRKKVTKVGLAPVQRDGLEFEFDIVGDMDTEHWLRISKTRCSALDNAVIHKPGPELASQILDWLEHGEAPKHIDWAALISGSSTAELSELWARAERAGVARLLRPQFSARRSALESAIVAEVVS